LGIFETARKARPTIINTTQSVTHKAMALHIRTLRLSGIRQFRDVTFDFTDPKTGKPLERVCFIGGNGTGKSTILRILASERLLNIRNASPTWIRKLAKPSFWAVEFAEADQQATVIPFQNQKCWVSNFLDAELFVSSSPFISDRNLMVSESEPWQAALKSTIAVYCPPDSELNPNSNSLKDVPSSNLNHAIEFLKNPESKFKIGQDSVSEFWKLLIALVKNRESRLLEYHKLPDNRDRTIREVEEEFLTRNPDILKELANCWEPILAKAGLVFDYEQASIPVQLTENLRAYVRLLTESATIPYAELSTGIRNYLFRLGHLFTIFRFHPGKGGIVLVDEPENSLYPDFLFELVAHYERAAPGAQLFFATHSPIVAAQFKPEERFILEFDPERGVVVRRGVTPEGDDPNDVLLKDFAVRTLYGPKGLENWKRFRSLDREIQGEQDTFKRKELLRQYLELGRTYNFGPHDEVPA
jgi:predicted ATPase